jgi:UDP-GlcNAc:undecaprenyl-phosphate GlcNAc-1-phosphate transferase
VRKIVDTPKRFSTYVLYMAISIGTFLLFLPATRAWFIGQGMRWFFLFLLSFFLSLLLTPAVRRLARRLDVLDAPSSRKAHERSSPLLGGMAIFLSFAIAVIYNLYFSFQLKGVAIGATLVMVFSLADDIWDLPALMKLMIQLCAVGVMVVYGVSGNFMPASFLGDGFEVLLTIFWRIGITNAVNFLDGMDGLATGLGLIASTFIGLVGPCRPASGSCSFWPWRWRAVAWDFSPTTSIPENPRPSFSGTRAASSSDSPWRGWPSWEIERSAIR